jgi:DNA repair protein RadC
MEALNRARLGVVAELSLSYRPKIKPSQRPIVNSSVDVYDILSGFWNKDHIELRETFCVMLLNNQNSVLGIMELYSGGFTATVVDPKLIFSIALKGCACSVILAHNHPSGNLKPSVADLTLTNKLVAAGKILELKVLDHIIISSEGYISLADEGYVQF